MEWIYMHRGDILILSLLAAVTAVIVINLMKKKSPCGSCKGCAMDCHGCSKK